MRPRFAKSLMVAVVLAGASLAAPAPAFARPCSEIQAEINKLIYDRDRLTAELRRERNPQRASQLRFTIDHRNRQIAYLRGQPCEKPAARPTPPKPGASTPFGGGRVTNVPVVRQPPPPVKQGRPAPGGRCVVGLDGECVRTR